MKPKNFHVAPSDTSSNRANAGAAPRRKGVVKGNRLQFTHTMAPTMFDQLNERAARYGQTRAGFINLILAKALASDEFK